MGGGRIGSFIGQRSGDDSLFRLPRGMHSLARVLKGGCAGASLHCSFPIRFEMVRTKKTTEARQRKERQRKRKDVRRVNAHFSNRSKLDVYQEVCKRLVGEIPPSVTKCEATLNGIHINIFDYVDEKYDMKMKNRRELIERCKRRGYYPRQRAKDENLRCMLETLFG